MKKVLLPQRSQDERVRSNRPSQNLSLICGSNGKVLCDHEQVKLKMEWVNVFRIIPEFRILMLTFLQRKNFADHDSLNMIILHFS